MKALILLWTVIDPIGTLPVFLAVARGLAAKQMQRLAVKAILMAAAVLTFFLVAGQLLLEALSIPLSAFQIAGGIVLFAFAMTMIFGESKPEQELHLLEQQSLNDRAVFPLAIPSIASPGAMMAIVLLTDNNRYQWLEQAMTWGVMMLVLLITLGLLLLAARIQRLIGDAGAAIISRIMGLILASVATDAILKGVSTFFNLGA